MSGPADSSSTYPGNPSLPREVRDKILSTFRHTINLFKDGKTDDCVIGCDFILKMDPRFGPARQLLEKSRNPVAAVDIAELEALVAETPTRQERAATPETDRLLVRAIESLNARDFDAAVATAEQVLRALPGNPHATEILQKARQRRDAAPQFDAARQRALAALDTGQRAEARAALEKMRSLDAEHPAVALLERRIDAPAAPPPRDVGETTNPGLDAAPPPPAHGGGGLDELSLDSLSLDEPAESPAVVPPPPNFGSGRSGPLSSLGMDEPEEPGAPPSLWGETPAEMPELSLDSAFSAPMPEPAPEEPESPSQEQEIESLLSRGDEAARSGNRQQAIEIWSRVFLIDINNTEAVTRIEKARQEMAEGNRRIADSLRRGRESFEAGDFTAAREAFLEVLALDMNEETARSYIDRIEQELARPSAGLDLSRKVPAGDILEEELAAAAAPQPEAIAEPEFEPLPAPPSPAPRRTVDKRFVAALGVAALLAVGAGAYFLLRPARPAPGRAAEGGPSLEHATMLFRDGKLAETIAELKRISPDSPDYARAQKLLTSLTRGKGRTADAASASAPEAEEASPAERAGARPSSEPSADSARLRAQAEQALTEKRYIEALKAFSAAGPAFQSDPTFAQSMAAASEKVSELTPAVKLYNEGEYETAIPMLWRIYQEDHDNQDARSYLVRSYYNLGVSQLHNGLFSKAAESFNEAIQLDPTDADAIRNKKFAERYLKGDLDMMGRIYVRHVQQRP
jgi:tetratricopeptide (TPR) repeat protein